MCVGAAIEIGRLVGALDAGCSLGPCGSSVEVSRGCKGAAIDIGLLPLGELVGLCCHFMVFERVGIALLGEGLGAGSDMSADCLIE